MWVGLFTICNEVRIVSTRPLADGTPARVWGAPNGHALLDLRAKKRLSILSF